MEPTTYVLIPGAWHGGWAWRPVGERLRASGHRVVTLTLPGLGDGDDPSRRRLQDAIDYVVAAVERSNADSVTLVGHSWAGYPMTGAIPRLRHRVAKAIFYNALIPVPGRSLEDDTAPENAHNRRERAGSCHTRYTCHLHPQRGRSCDAAARDRAGLAAGRGAGDGARKP